MSEFTDDDWSALLNFMQKFKGMSPDNTIPISGDEVLAASLNVIALWSNQSTYEVLRLSMDQLFFGTLKARWWGLKSLYSYAKMYRKLRLQHADRVWERMKGEIPKEVEDTANRIEKSINESEEE